MNISKENNFGKEIKNKIVLFTARYFQYSQTDTSSVNFMHRDFSTNFFSRLYFSYTEAVTYGYVVNSFPYRNTVDIVELTGKDLTLVFEQVATLYDKNDPSNSFLQVSGNCVLFSKSLNIIWVNFNRKPGIASIMLCFALRLVQRTRAALSTNQIQNLKQPQLGHPRFPALLIV